MSECCDHDDCHAFEPGALGIPRVGPFNPEAFEKAVTDLLLACGVAASPRCCCAPPQVQGSPC